MPNRARTARASTLVVGGVAAAATAAVVRTLAAFRPTAEERRWTLRGDEIVHDPMYATMQAVTIDAPPERVWPWLAQLGAGRGGWYSYGRIDNGGRPSADAIIPELQDVAPGDILPATPGATDAFLVAVAEPPRDLVLVAPAGEPVVSWAFHVASALGGRSRLLVRVRVSPRWRELAAAAPAASHGAPLLIERVYGVLARLPQPLMLAATGFGHRVMQNRQLRGIRRRAEAATRELRHAS